MFLGFQGGWERPEGFDFTHGVLRATAHLRSGVSESATRSRSLCCARPRVCPVFASPRENAPSVSGESTQSGQN